ncbi:DUF6056 family protein [Ruminococcus sp. XPD3002]|uniref:DUF6056 family protein n=1 Tax=Ruminococcus sp. XPD3002 TaxID=1452269 RepID=UPI00091F4080|nr:hypothetical protein SAMN04487832_1223 [Ruminococcus flavefaciens]
MLNKIKENKFTFIVCGIFMLYAIIQCSTFVMSGDDYWWSSLDTISQVFSDSNMNGRYFTNFITFYIIKFPYLRPLICVPFLVALFFLIANVLKTSKKSSLMTYLISGLCIMLVPSGIAMLTTLWISGFTNYVISLVLTLIYINFITPLFDGETCKLPVWSSLLFFVLGFAGTLCVENITIYNCILAVFTISFSFVRFKKIHIAHVAYLVGTVIGTVVMFLNPNYHQITSDEGDQQGFRAIEFDFSDIFSTLYRDVSTAFSHSFLFVHLAIAVSITVLFYKKYHSLNSKGAPKYAKIFLPVIIAYAAYSAFSQVFCGLISMTPALRVNAILLAFAFIYMLGIVYMSFVLLDLSRFIKVTFLICSVIIVTAPFIVVKPITPRCFFATYIFWCLTAGSLLMEMFDVISTIQFKSISCVLSVLFSFICFILSDIYISNYCVDQLCIDYVKEQYESNSRVIEVIDLPYTEYCSFSIYYYFSKYNDEKSLLNDAKTYYTDYIIKYWGFDKELLNKKFVEISIQDYYMSHSLE